MKTWNDYKEHVRAIDSQTTKDIDEVEYVSSMISTMTEQHTSLDLNQFPTDVYIVFH